MSPAAGSSGGSGSDELQVPIAELFRSLATELASAQRAMDCSSLAATDWMGGERRVSDGPSAAGAKVPFALGHDADGRRVAHRTSWVELGFVPTFYQFVDTLIEVRLTLRLTASSGEFEAYGVTVGADYASTYGFATELTSILRTRFVPVPPPPGLVQLTTPRD